MVMVMVVCYGVELAHHHVARDERSTLKSPILIVHQIFPDFELGCCPSRIEGNGTTKGSFMSPKVAFGCGRRS